MKGIIDSHTHLDAENFNGELSDIIARAQKAGVAHFISVSAGDGFGSCERAIKIAEQYDFISATAGVHPNDAQIPLDKDRLLHFATNENVVALGETGLDFHRDSVPENLQTKWFSTHIEVALQVKKPLIIHSRNAGEKCLKILQDMNACDVGGVFHCYGEDGRFAKELKKINFLVSFTGIVTFKNASTVKQAVADIPIDQMMVETDAPYLAPVPYRGKRNEPSYIVETVKEIAKIKNISYQDCVSILTTNTKKFFQLS